MKLAVYGTLRSGEVRGPVLADYPCLGTFRTDSCHTMYDLGAYPAVKNEGDSPIVVELYEVDDDAMAICDRIEGVSFGLYKRDIAYVNGEHATIYTYLHDTADDRVIASGDWCNR